MHLATRPGQRLRAGTGSPAGVPVTTTCRIVFACGSASASNGAREASTITTVSSAWVRMIDVTVSGTSIIVLRTVHHLVDSRAEPAHGAQSKLSG